MKTNKRNCIMLIILYLFNYITLARFKTKTPNRPFNILTSEDVPFNSFEKNLSSPLNLFEAYDGEKIESNLRKYICFVCYFFNLYNINLL